MKRTWAVLIFICFSILSGLSQNNPSAANADLLTGRWDAVADYRTRDGEERKESAYDKMENVYLFRDGKLTVYDSDGRVMDESNYLYRPEKRILNLDGMVELKILKLNEGEMEIGLYEGLNDSLIQTGRRVFRRIE